MLPIPVIEQLLELFVWIEGKSRPWEMTRFARTVAMHADDVIGLAGEAERKFRLSGIRVDTWVPGEALRIEVMQILQLRPKQLLELAVVEIDGRETLRSRSRADSPFVECFAA